MVGLMRFLWSRLRDFWLWLTCRDWVALYLPSTDSEDPTRSGFRTRNRAYAYAQEHFCRPDCAGCDAEWLIIPTRAAVDSVNYGDLFKAAGFRRVQ